MPLETDELFGLCYLSSADFIARADVFGASAYIAAYAADAVKVKALLAMASRDVDSFCGRDFSPAARTEQHKWRPETRRVSVNAPPVAAVSSFAVVVGAGQRATFQADEVLVNNQENYVELVALATAESLTSQIIALGITQPFVEIVYTTLQDIPPKVRLAVGHQATHRAKLASEAGNIPAGISSFSVGPLSVGFNNKTKDVGLCDAARDLLMEFKRFAIG
jgi:hypothetical protein